MEIDCRGLSCPAPVLKTKEALEASDLPQVTVIVDNEAARQNVSRFLSSKGYSVNVDVRGREFRVTGHRPGQTKEKEAHDKGALEESKGETKKVLVMITTDRLGHGDDNLGQALMKNFLKTLKEIGKDLWRVIFLNNGVKLTVNGSDAVEPLKELEQMGVKILVCGTCLSYFNLLEEKAVGETTNMLDVVTSLQIADNVINI